MNTTAAVSQLAEPLRGPVLTPASPAYDATRTVFNGVIDRRPALIAVCADANDVVTCVKYAADASLPLSVRGGGHNFAGKAVCEAGLMIDCSQMKAISVDAARRTARAQSGLNLGEFDRATQRHGLATTLGVATTTGIAGLTLGGGYGWLAGQYGLACDNLLAAKVVTANGSLVACSAYENADLFWALRGGGANFGVVTELEYRLHPLTEVLGGPIFYPLEPGVIRFYDEYARAAPDELTLLGAAMTAPGGVPGFAIFACWCGSPSEGQRLVEPLRKFGRPIADLLQMRPYLEMQSLFDPMNVPGRRYYNKAHNVSRVTDDTIDQLIDCFRDVPSPGTAISLQQLHGAAARVPTQDTAFPHRYPHHVTWIGPIWDDPQDDERMIGWGRSTWRSLQPFADRAVYVNALEDATEAGERPVREAYGANYERLVALKKRFDPHNLFNQNSNLMA